AAAVLEEHADPAAVDQPERRAASPVCDDPAAAQINRCTSSARLVDRAEVDDGAGTTLPPDTGIDGADDQAALLVGDDPAVVQIDAGAAGAGRIADDRTEIRDRASLVVKRDAGGGGALDQPMVGDRTARHQEYGRCTGGTETGRLHRAVID